MNHSVLEMKKISIEFPGVKALDEVDFIMTSGTTHALIGANGAGKSTLMKVLSGAYTHYTGEILIDQTKRSSSHLKMHKKMVYKLFIKKSTLPLSLI